jgi:AraC-like DNA-binding protein
MRAVVTRHATPAGGWEFAERAPHPSLRGDFARIVGFDERYRAPLRRLEIPFAGAALIVSLGPRHRMLDPAKPGAAPYERCSFIAGVHDQATVVEHDGVASGLEIHFTPLGARRFLGIPGSELTNQVVELEDVLGREARDLAEELGGLSTWDERFDRLEAAVLARARQAPLLPPAVEWAWRRLRDTHGGAPVRDLAGELGCSRRHLARSVGAELGLPPKALARVLRFERATALLRAGHDLADVAYSCGYYDQPHFNRDFRALAGTTPTGFLARALPGGAGTAG